MKYQRVVFRLHALQRMFERQINTEEIEIVLESGEVIEDYPNDTPYPSSLISGSSGSRPLHVVAALTDEKTAIIVTVYEPDLQHWEPGFRKRRRP